MARAREIPDLAGDNSYGDAAAKVLAVRSDELFEHAGGVLDTADIERLHDMRVATRRLRAALEIFEGCFPRGELKSALREVKALADALGERRDRDVTIAALDAFAEQMPAPDRPGIRTLVERLRDEQGRANRELAGYVDPDRLAALERRLRALVAAPRATVGPPGSRPVEPDVISGNGSGG